MTPLLAEDALILTTGDPAAGPDADPDASIVSHWRCIRREHVGHSDLHTSKSTFLDQHRRWRDHAPIGLEVGDQTEELIGDLESGRLATVVDPHEQHPSKLVVWQIVGKRADGLASLLRSVTLQGLLPLYEV